MPKYSKNKSDLMDRLKNQIRFLESSAASYDSGLEGEAQNTKKMKSLLHLLGKKNIPFYDMASELHPANLAPHNGLVLMRLSSDTGMNFVAPLDSPRPSVDVKKVSFTEWWDKVVIKDSNGQMFTRRDIILTVADKEGGAHVDPELDEAYVNLTKFNSMGWRVVRQGTEGFPNNAPVLPSVRQIAHEVLKSLRDEFPDLVGPLPSLQL